MSRIITIIGLLVVMSAPALAADLEFVGSFSEVESSEPPCDAVFAVTDYTTKHFFLSASYSIVTYFEGTGGFFDGLTFSSNLGYNDDFLYERDVTVDGKDYLVEIYGYIDDDFVYMEARVVAVDGEGEPLCSAAANFTGFLPEP